MRAYAYLFHPADRVLSETAYERLRTIGDHTELGSGFKIALRDLQIRGAGNLLGRDQSGHIAAIGYDLYVQMVSEPCPSSRASPGPGRRAVGRPPRCGPPPPGYVEAEDVRLEAYRRLSAVRTVAEVADVRAEWRTASDPAGTGAALLEVALLRVECLRLGVDDLAVSVPRFTGEGAGPRGGPGGRAVAKLTPITLPASAEVRLRRLAPGAATSPRPSACLPDRPGRRHRRLCAGPGGPPARAGPRRLTAGARRARSRPPGRGR